MKSLLAFIAVLFTFMLIINNALDLFERYFNNPVIAFLGVLFICAIGVITGRALDEKANYQ